MAQHTPAPWAADFHNERREGGRFVTCVNGGNQIVPIAAVPSGVEGYGREEGRANARLIAAAPELLEACANWIGWLDSDGWVENAADHETRMLDAMRAAVAKARGETP